MNTIECLAGHYCCSLDLQCLCFPFKQVNSSSYEFAIVLSTEFRISLEIIGLLRHAKVSQTLQTMIDCSFFFYSIIGVCALRHNIKGKKNNKSENMILINKFFLNAL